MSRNLFKGPVKLVKRVKIPHSFYSLCQISSSYHFKFAYVVLHMAVKGFLETHF